MRSCISLTKGRAVVERLTHISGVRGSRRPAATRFQFTDGYSIHVHVFRAGGFEGEPKETEEAKPLWFDTAAIPYEEMWEDDILWIPHVLGGVFFDGRYLFDGDAMLDHEIETGRR